MGRVFWHVEYDEHSKVIQLDLWLEQHCTVGVMTPTKLGVLVYLTLIGPYIYQTKIMCCIHLIKFWIRRPNAQAEVLVNHTLILKQKEHKLNI